MCKMSFASHKTDVIPFPAEEATFAFFGGSEQGASAASIVILSLAQSDGPNANPY